MPVSRATVLGFLLSEVLLFLAAVLVHGGVIVKGYEHGKAASAEAVITAVLTAGLIIGASRPFAARTAALCVQGFALLGVCVGVAMILTGVGPSTVPDLTLHATMIALLIAGLVAASRS